MTRGQNRQAPTATPPVIWRLTKSRSTGSVLISLLVAITIACGGGPTTPSISQVDCFTGTPSHLAAGSNFDGFDIAGPVMITRGTINFNFGSNIPTPNPRIQRAVMTLEGNLPCPQAITLTLSLASGKVLTLWNGQGPCDQAGRTMPAVTTWIPPTEIPEMAGQDMNFNSVAVLKSDGRKQNIPTGQTGGGCGTVPPANCLGKVNLKLSVDYMSYGPPFKC